MKYQYQYYQGVIKATVSTKSGDNTFFGKFSIDKVNAISNILIFQPQKLSESYDPKKIAVSEHHLRFKTIRNQVIKIIAADQQLHEFYGSIYDVIIKHIRPGKENMQHESEKYFLDLNEPADPGLFEIAKYEDLNFITFWGNVFFTIREEIPQEKNEISETITQPGVYNSVLSDEKPILTDSGGGSATKKSNDGCLKYIGYLFWFLLLYSLINYLIHHFPDFLVLVKSLIPFIVIFSLFWFILKYLRSGVGLLLGALLVLISFVYLYTFISNTNRNKNKDDVNPVVKTNTDDDQQRSEFIVDSISELNDNNDSILIVHHRIWNDYKNNRYEADLKIGQQAYFNNKKLRESFEPPNNGNSVEYWNGIYLQLLRNNSNSLKYIYAAFDSIRRANQLSNNDFVSVIVSCVQDIPYKFIVESSCESFIEKNPGEISTFRKNGCMGEIKFGVQSPAEFIYNLNGDCDTRALLLYALLDHYNYDVALLISQVYQHAMLGINIQSTGSYLTNYGKKYFVWETTATGFLPGQVAPDWTNMKNWDFCLISK